MIAGEGMNAFTRATGTGSNAKDVFIVTSRLRFTF